MAKRTTRTRRTKKVEEEVKQVEENITKPEEIEELPPKVEEEAPAEETKVVNTEETKVVKPKQTKKKVDVTQLDVNTPQYVEEVLRSSKDLDELLENLKKSPLTRSLATRLATYKKEMDPKRVMDAKYGAGKNYDLYLAIINIANTDDISKFQLLFKVLNKVFLLGKNGAFSPINLSRYDYEWRWGVKSKKNYERLVELISTLAHPGNRKQIGKTISLEKAVDGLPEKAKHNIIRFYQGTN